MTCPSCHGPLNVDDNYGNYEISCYAYSGRKGCTLPTWELHSFIQQHARGMGSAMHEAADAAAQRVVDEWPEPGK